MSVPTLNANQAHHTLYRQYIQVGETADQARAAVSQTEAEAKRRHTASAQQQAFMASMEFQHMEAQAERVQEERPLSAKLKSKKLSKAKNFC